MAMRRLWLIFSQVVAGSLAIVFVLLMFRPNLLKEPSRVITVKEAAPVANLQEIPSFRASAKKAMPAVVNIFTSKALPSARSPFGDDPLFRYFFGEQLRRPQRVASLGSGVIVTPQGYIVTNNHVVEAADQIEVALADTRTANARLIGTDPETDLAVLKIDLDNLSPITFSQPDQAQIGDVVLAIGNPFGVGQTVTMGIISALRRNQLGINTFENFIQTDAAINPGNSGGALIDISGNLIGVNSAIFSRTGGSLGIGFAIPGSLVRQVMDQIIKDGVVVRGWIGVEVQDLTPEISSSFKLATTEGALISGVLQGGPADKGGIKPGDVLVKVNNKPITNAATMLTEISEVKPGTTARLDLVRERTSLSLNVAVQKRPRVETVNPTHLP